MELRYVIQARSTGAVPVRCGIGIWQRATRSLARLGIRANVKLADRIRVGTVDANQPKFHVVRIVQSGVVIPRDSIVATHGDPQRFGDFAHVDSQRRGALAVDLHLQLGLVPPKRRVHVNDTRDPPRFCGQPLAVFG